MKKKLFLLFEILLWLALVIGILFSLISVFHPDLKIKETYDVDFRDVDGVIVGSPVRFMGLNIGHVKKITVMKDRVRLHLAIIEDNFKLPKTSMIKIEASSLGGSRSLELFPSNEIFQSKKILAVEPMRITELYTSSSEFVESMSDSMANIKRIMEMALNSETYQNIDEVNAKLALMDDELYKLSEMLEDKKSQFSSNFDKTKDSLASQVDALRQVEINKKQIISQSKAFEKSLQDLSNSLEKYNPSESKQVMSKFYKKSKRMKFAVSKVNPKQEMAKLLNDLKALQSFLYKLETSLESDNLDETKDKVKSLKELTRQLNKRL